MIFNRLFDEPAGSPTPGRSVTPAAVAADIRRCAPAPVGVLPSSVPLLLAALANHDGPTYIHSLRVAHAAWTLAQAHGHALPGCRWVYLAGLLHDVGKIYLPRAVLQAGGTELGGDGHDLIHTQAAHGAQLVQQHPDIAALAPIIATQYEQPDGWGTPHGLQAAEIPVATAFVAVAEALNTLLFCGGVYAVPVPAYVRDVLLAGAGRRWDAAIATTAAHLVADGAPRLLDAQVLSSREDQLLVV